MGCRVMRDVVDGADVRGHGEVRVGRRFTPEYKARVLAELDAAEDQGAKGAIVRREGLVWSTVSRWRAKRDAAVREGLSERKRGPKVDRLARENQGSSCSRKRWNSAKAARVSSSRSWFACMLVQEDRSRRRASLASLMRFSMSPQGA